MRKMKTTTTNENCVHIALNKSRQKEFGTSLNRIVYLENKDEFQIELFNPYHYTIGVGISFDGENESNKLLILKPGERFWLDRYLDSPKRFMFSTYEVENSEEAKEAISENGKVTIKFYKEKKQEKPKITWRSNVNSINLEDYTTDWWNDNKITYYDDSNKTVYKTVLDNKPCNSILNCSINDSDVSSFASTVMTSNYSCSTQNYNDTIETGRIEEGSNSNQYFHETNQEFENWPFKTETIKLLPKSQKPITTDELKKRYCYNCGRKLKEKFKFCPFCGAEI